MNNLRNKPMKEDYTFAKVAFASLSLMIAFISLLFVFKSNYFIASTFLFSCLSFILYKNVYDEHKDKKDSI